MATVSTWILLLIFGGFAFGGIYRTGLNKNEEFTEEREASNRAGNLSEVRYMLWTRSNPGDSEYYLLDIGNQQNLAESPFDGTLRTYFKYHGFSDQGDAGWILAAKRDLLILEACNVISVDWRTLVQSPYYDSAVDNMYMVADQTAGLIDWLIMDTPLVSSQVHITGHSLGAHAAGMTGYYVQSGIVDRVTGLDPAGPWFYNKTDDERISTLDASFVDILHTNSGDLLDGCIALYDSVGHVDFYPNGGSHQPGCPRNTTVADWMDLFSGCSHARVTSIWVESILGASINGTVVPFTSWPCVDWRTFAEGGCPDCAQGCLNMGLHTERNLVGNYYLRTRSESPYAVGSNQEYDNTTQIILK